MNVCPNCLCAMVLIDDTDTSECCGRALAWTCLGCPRPAHEAALQPANGASRFPSARPMVISALNARRTR